MLHWTGFNSGLFKVQLQGRSDVVVGGKTLACIPAVHVIHMRQGSRLVVVENKPPDFYEPPVHLAQGIAEVISSEETNRGILVLLLAVSTNTLVERNIDAPVFLLLACGTRLSFYRSKLSQDHVKQIRTDGVVKTKDGCIVGVDLSQFQDEFAFEPVRLELVCSQVNFY